MQSAVDIAGIANLHRKHNANSAATGACLHGSFLVALFTQQAASVDCPVETFLTSIHCRVIDLVQLSCLSNSQAAVHVVYTPASYCSS